MRDVAVAGAGIVDFGGLFEQSLDEMAERAFMDAVDAVDHGVEPRGFEPAV